MGGIDDTPDEKMACPICHGEGEILKSEDWLNRIANRRITDAEAEAAFESVKDVPPLSQEEAEAITARVLKMAREQLGISDEAKP